MMILVASRNKNYTKIKLITKPLDWKTRGVGRPSWVSCTAEPLASSLLLTCFQRRFNINSISSILYPGTWLLNKGRQKKKKKNHFHTVQHCIQTRLWPPLLKDTWHNVISFFTFKLRTKLSYNNYTHKDLNSSCIVWLNTTPTATTAPNLSFGKLVSYTVSSVPHHMNLHHTGDQMVQRTTPLGGGIKMRGWQQPWTWIYLKRKKTGDTGWIRKTKQDSINLHFELDVAIIQFIFKKAVLIFWSLLSVGCNECHRWSI